MVAELQAFGQTKKDEAQQLYEELEVSKHGQWAGRPEWY